MDEETAGKMRSLIRRANLKNFKDDGETQTCSVEVAEGIWRDDVEVAQPYGSVGQVPEDGAIGIVVSIGADEGDLVVLSVANPSVRMGAAREGDVGLVNRHGDRMTISDGGVLDAQSAVSMTFTTASGHLK
ncbi:MAG: phage baseplate assembly protein [Ahrensia sp.]|nr:phage baseplate assembly protein [Ahrensia sp.]